METFREKLKLQNITYAFCAIVLAVFCFLGFASEAGLVDFLRPASGDEHWISRWNGFLSGVAFGFLAFLIYGLIRNFRAIRSEKALKRLYVKQHDERTLQIWIYARAAAFQTILILGLVAIIVSGYFSMTVSITILACVWFASIIAFTFKVYYSKKF